MDDCAFSVLALGGGCFAHKAPDAPLAPIDRAGDRNGRGFCKVLTVHNSCFMELRHTVLPFALMPPLIQISVSHL